MSIFDKIFGGSKTKPTKPVDLTPAEYLGLRPDIAAALRSMFQGGGPVFTGGPTLTAPQIVNPAIAPLQSKISQLQTELSGLNKPVRIVSSGGDGPRGEGPGPTTSFGITPETQARIDELKAQIAAAQKELAGLPQLVANPEFRAPTPESVAAGTAHLAPGLTGGARRLIAQTVESALRTGPAERARNALLLGIARGEGLRPGSNPFLAAAIEAAQRPVIEAFQNVVVPDLLSRFTSAGQTIQGAGSSAFGQTANQASEILARSLGDISANMAAANYQAERDRQIQATSQITKLRAEKLNNMVTALQSALLPTMIRDQGIQRGLEQFNRQVQTILEALRLATTAGGPHIGQAGGGKTESSGILSAIPIIQGLGKGQ